MSALKEFLARVTAAPGTNGETPKVVMLDNLHRVSKLDDVFEGSPGSAGGTSPLGGDDDYSVFGRATMKAQSAALVQVRGGERRSGAPARRPPLKTRGPLRGALRVGRPLAPKSLNPQD